MRVGIICAWIFSGNYGAKSLDAVGYPAKHQNVICVGSCNEYGNVCDESSRGKDVEFLCPGKNVLSTYAGGK